jgi:hypothetical protein
LGNAIVLTLIHHQGINGGFGADWSVARGAVDPFIDGLFVKSPDPADPNCRDYTL